MAQQILLLDDDPAIAYQRALILGMHGFKVDAASNLEEAMEKRQNADYDLVLVALREPEQAEAALAWCEESKMEYPHQQFALLVPAFAHVRSDCPDDIIPKDGPAQLVERVKRLMEPASAG